MSAALRLVEGNEDPHADIKAKVDRMIIASRDGKMPIGNREQLLELYGLSSGELPVAITYLREIIHHRALEISSIDENLCLTILENP